MVEQAEKINFTINKSQCGQRLDIYLAQSEAALSRSQVKYAIEEGDVLVNDKVPKVGQRLKEGDVIILTKKPPVEAKAVAQEIPLDIIYEDDAVIVINKPAGMVVHPAPGNPEKRWSMPCFTIAMICRASAAFCAPVSCTGWIKTHPV